VEKKTSGKKMKVVNIHKKKNNILNNKRKVIETKVETQKESNKIIKMKLKNMKIMNNFLTTVVLEETEVN